MEESGGINLYGFVGNEGVGKWDYLGGFIGSSEDVRNTYESIKNLPKTNNAWISPETFNKINSAHYKGHREMYNQKTKCKRWNVDADFDWRYEDDREDFRAGYSNETTAAHFQTQAESERQIENAIKNANALDFERAMHRLQDFWSHRNKGFTWGHAVGGLAYKSVKNNLAGYGRVDNLFLSPDLDNVAWESAHNATKTWLGKWNSKCCCSENKDALDTRTHNYYTWRSK